MHQTQLLGRLAFIERAENLKNTLRSAHTTSGRQESAAEHSWRLCLLVLVFADAFQGVDCDRLLRLAVIHDLAEAVCGDLPAPSQTGQGDKSSMEREAMRVLCRGLSTDISTGLLELWEEYEAGTTQEAAIVKGLDKLETIIQHNQGANPQDFDYHFNLTYGQTSMQAHPLLGQIRAILDAATRARDSAKGPEALSHPSSNT